MLTSYLSLFTYFLNLAMLLFNTQEQEKIQRRKNLQQELTKKLISYCQRVHTLYYLKQDKAAFDFLMSAVNDSFKIEILKIVRRHPHFDQEISENDSRCVTSIPKFNHFKKVHQDFLTEFWEKKYPIEIICDALYISHCLEEDIFSSIKVTNYQSGKDLIPFEEKEEDFISSKYYHLKQEVDLKDEIQMSSSPSSNLIFSDLEDYCRSSVISLKFDSGKYTLTLFKTFIDNKFFYHLSSSPEPIEKSDSSLLFNKKFTDKLSIKEDIYQKAEQLNNDIFKELFTINKRNTQKISLKAFAKLITHITFSYPYRDGRTSLTKNFIEPLLEEILNLPPHFKENKEYFSLKNEPLKLTVQLIKEILKDCATFPEEDREIDISARDFYVKFSESVFFSAELKKYLKDLQEDKIQLPELTSYSRSSTQRQSI